MQHRAKHFTAQVLYTAHFNQRGRHKVAVAAFCGQLQARHAVALAAHGVDIGFNICLGLCVNHGAYIGGQLVGVANAQLLHGAAQHVQHVVGTVVLQAQQAQR